MGEARFVVGAVHTLATPMATLSMHSIINAQWRHESKISRIVNYEKRLLASSCLQVRLPVRMVQFGSHWTDLHEILYLRIFRNSIQKIQVSLI